MESLSSTRLYTIARFLAVRNTSSFSGVAVMVELPRVITSAFNEFRFHHFLFVLPHHFDSDMDSAELHSLFVSIGLSEQKAKETCKNAALSNTLRQCVENVQKYSGNSSIDKDVGKLLYNLSTKLKSQIYDKIPFLVEYIGRNKITSDLQLDSALSYLLSNPTDPVDIKMFEESCGVGVSNCFCLLIPVGVASHITNNTVKYMCPSSAFHLVPR